MTCKPRACTSARCFSTPAPTRWCGAFPKRAARTRCRPAARRVAALTAASGACLVDAIELERELLAALREVSTVIDTSQLRPAQLSAWVRDLVGAARPADAGVRILRFQVRRAAGRRLRLRRARAAQPALRSRAAADERPRRARGRLPEAQPDVGEMLTQIEAFLRRWLGRLRGQPAQLPHGRHRLHRRAAPFGLSQRVAGEAFRRPRSGTGAPPRAGRPRMTVCCRAGPSTLIDSREHIADLPLFPLRAVLFPAGLLALKVFEARYVDMVADCLRHQRPFGVVCLLHGGEVRRPSTPVPSNRRLRAAGRCGQRPARHAACALHRHTRFRFVASRSKPMACGLARCRCPTTIRHRADADAAGAVAA